MSSIPKGYAKCHDATKISLEELLMLTNSITSTISGGDTMRPLCI